MDATAIPVDHIARVEGHGDIRLVIEDGQVTTCEMAVVEPARLFESMVRGRSFEEVPYIASRVCGICSSSHVVTDLRAIERVFGVEVTDRTEALRELLVYGSYLQNHAHAPVRVRRPGLLGPQVGVPVGRERPGAIRARAGLEGAGQRAVHPGGRPQHPSHHGGGGRASPTRYPPTSTCVWPRQDGRHARVRLEAASICSATSRHRGRRDGRRHARHGGAR